MACQRLLSLRVRGPAALARKQVDRLFAGLAETVKHHADPEVRGGAIHALAGWEEARARRLLLAVVEDGRQPAIARAEAAEGLAFLMMGESGSERVRAVRALRLALDDASARVRFWSLYALGMLHAEEARSDVESLVGDVSVWSDGWWSVGDEARDVLDVMSGGTWPVRSVETSPRSG